jgi:putative RNA 2'-phosphotransferase
MKNIQKISKYLSYILRHNPTSVGLYLDAHGWANIDELIKKTKDFRLSKTLLLEVVRDNNKQRFIIEENKIRANQGHSIKIDLDLKELQPPNILYHGTATRFLENIMLEGLNKQARHHVHLSLELETAKNVGQRHGKVVILEVDSQKMYEEGFSFYCSQNAVWLTEFVPIKFLKRLG